MIYGGQQMKKCYAIIMALLVAAALFAAPAGALSAQVKDKGKLKVTYINVQMGDATLIEFPSGKTMLIDGGRGYIKYYKFDAGTEIIMPYLARNGINKLDYVVATHSDFDHMGGLMSVIDHIPTGNFIEPGLSTTSWTYRVLLKLVDEKGINYIQAKKGLLIDTGDSAVACEILAPETIEEKLGSNDNSVVIKLTYGGVSFLFTGDAEKKEERMLTETYGEALSSTFYKAGHHGSLTSSNDFFMEAVDPEYVIISAGKNNQYGLPVQKRVDDFLALGAEIYRTDMHGTITVMTDGDSWSIDTERNPLFFQVAKAGEPQYQLDVEDIEIEGILVEMTYYGPPFYRSKTNTVGRHSYYGLTPPSPIFVVALSGEEGSEERIDKVHGLQVIAGSGQTDMQDYLGKNVRIRGVLSSSDKEWIKPEVLLRVHNIKTLK